MTPPKVLFAFISACHKSRTKYALETFMEMQGWRKWGLKFDYKFIFGNITTQQESDRWNPLTLNPNISIHPSLQLEFANHCLFFNVDDTRRWMALKNQELFRYALSDGYDFVFRACDDTKVFPHRLLKHDIAFKHDYFGTMCGYGQIHGIRGAFVLRYMDYMHGGVGIGLSRKAMNMLALDIFPGPDSSPYGNSNEIDILPGHAVRGGWGTYWDDLWIGEVLKGNMSYSDPRRNDTYYNYLVDVYDNPQLFASNNPFDATKVISHHSLEQMGTTDLTPGAFSTLFSKSTKVEIPYDAIEPTFHINGPGK